MVKTVSLPKFRSELDIILGQADQDTFVVEKNGDPVAVVMSIDEYEDYLETYDKKFQAGVKRAMQEYRSGKAKPAVELVEELDNELSRSQNTKIRSRR